MTLLDEAQRRALVEIVESGPIPASHGVVRWRLIDLAQWVWDEFAIRISKQTLSREMRAMGYRKLTVLVWHLLTKEKDYFWVRPSLVVHKMRSMELQTGKPQKKGNSRGPAYAYNVKELRNQEMHVAEQAQRSYEHFIAAWRPRPR